VANSFSHSQTSVLGSVNLEKGSSEFTQSKEGFQKGPPYKQLHIAINGELFDNLCNIRCCGCNCSGNSDNRASSAAEAPDTLAGALKLLQQLLRVTDHEGSA
jgi:hypothetical protein